ACLPRGECAFVSQVETREDEEQSVKLAEILELLLAAGYFRARIKGLSPFDKVVGGMTWCITTCNFDIDVDLLFQENSTIGQKIALTEKIVSVLPKMKCPHRLEPHQIQGLDFIHIFPVIQWLVKRAIETREEMGDYVRAYSISQFQKTHSFPEDEEFLQRKDKAVKAVLDVSDVYKPQRKYRRQADAGELLDEESRVHSTLLEYEHFFLTEITNEYLFYLLQLRIKTLMTNMAAMATEEGKLTASAVGQIVGLQSEEIKQIASEYAEKQSELSSDERSERYGPLQQHRRTVASLNKQIQHKTKQLEEVSTPLFPNHTKLEKELKSLEEVETQADSSLLEKLRALVAMNENLKQQEQEFRTHCRVSTLALRSLLHSCCTNSPTSKPEPVKSSVLIYNSMNSPHMQFTVAILHYGARETSYPPLMCRRRWPEITQRRKSYFVCFVLLITVSATHKETKQFFTLYNTLDDKKVYLEKEVNLLNSIHDNFQQAMSSSGAKEQFLRQMEQIVEGIKQSRIKMEKKKQENKMRRDQLNDEYLELLDKQRLYFKTVKDFKEECRKNEMLLSKLRAKGAS
uniref:Coiled-coil domain-containing protein 93 n=1 Tax=Myripristis murdjan TaxID=586833 RepID=A0A667ZLR6_9TELE